MDNSGYKSMGYASQRSEQTSSFGVHRSADVPLSAFEAGALGNGAAGTAHPPAMPGTGDDVPSIVDALSARRLRFAAGGIVALTLLIVLL